MARQMPRHGAIRARARHAPGVMNKAEERYAREQLAPAKAAGVIRDWRFEPLKLRIGDKCFYTPDFLVVTAEGFIELHEFKGHWEDDARVKIKAAASLYPWFTFIAITRARKVKPPAVQKVAPEVFVFETIRAHHSEVTT